MEYIYEIQTSLVLHHFLAMTKGHFELDKLLLTILRVFLAISSF